MPLRAANPLAMTPRWLPLPRVIGVLTLLALGIGAARLADPLPEGLRAAYSVSPDAGEPVPAGRIDRAPSTASLTRAWRGRPPERFRAAWSGSIFVWTPGRYTFSTTSDDGSTVRVDDELVVDNGGEHAAHPASGSIALDRGVHSLLIDYAQDGGGLSFDLRWASEGQTLRPIPGWRLSPRRASLKRTLASVLVRRALGPILLMWIATILATAVRAAAPAVGRRLETIGGDPLLRTLAGVILFSLALNAVGLWWGLPSTWPGDELTPIAVYGAVVQRFSNGWWDRYPPLQFFVLGAASAPAMWLRDLGWLQVSERALDGILIGGMRLVSLAAGVGTLAAVYACGARVFGRRAGVCAAAALSMLTLFVYYSKTANPEVPYLFWFAVSLAFYLRFLQTLALSDVMLFAAAATASMCTKDQAYGLYLATPVVFVYRLWEANRVDGEPRALLRAMVDRRILAAGATVVVLFAAVYLLPFNLDGFVAHFRDISGPGSQPWRMFEPTVGGHLALLETNLVLNQRAWGWPLTFLAAAGTAAAIADRTTRRASIFLLAPVVSYYFGFIDLVLYTFDRYVLPMCIVEALFAGFAIDRFLGPATGAIPAWRRALVALALAYTLLYAAAVDVLMVLDSRYAAETWLRPRLRAAEGVGINFPDQVLPRLDGIATERIGSLPHLKSDRPAYFILNADYARAIGADTLLGDLVAGLQDGRAGYHLAFRYRAPAPWPWLGGHPDLVGPRLEPRVLSILRGINPTIEIYARN
ncbi:MAG: glycosyltransferase family 39 protein [Acidobacteria bacterium]|nr:glycosyltransferase family 39 protein [Acidobacteriota bacterium]